MTISIISTGKHFDHYTMVRSFFANKGVTYKMFGPYSREHNVSFNLPLVNTDDGFYKTLVPLYSYKSDLADWMSDMIEQCGWRGFKQSKELPLYGLIILFGEEGEKVKSYLKFSPYHEVLSRISIITNPENFDQELERVWDKFQLFWAKEENKRIS